MFKQLDEAGRVVAVWATEQEIEVLREYVAESDGILDVGEGGSLSYLGVPVYAHPMIPEADPSADPLADGEEGEG